MLKRYKTVIAGGGASGLLCAIELTTGDGALGGEDVLVVDRNDRAGKKLAATGNGQGNFANADVSLKHYYGESNFIDAFFNKDFVDVPKYFYKLGIPLYPDSDGRFYPLSKQAASAVDLLINILKKSKCQIKTSLSIVDANKTAGGYIINFDNGEKVFAENLVLATGGKAGAQFGTDGSSYRLAEKFGHKLTPLYPSLVQVKTDRTAIRGLKGVKQKVTLYLFDGKKEVASSTGDLLFTDYGVSGNTVFSLSAKLAETKEPIFYADLIPELSIEEVEKILIYRKTSGIISDDDLLTGIINKKTGQAIMRSLRDKSPRFAAHAVKKFKLEVKGTLGFDCAQVTKGGIVTDDVNPFSLQSKLSKNLYIIGEALNVDGDCGGYNLTFAFSSGIRAAEHIKSNNR